MESAAVIESILSEVLKSRGYRKRARNWFRATSAGEYQVVNLQKSSWGGGQCYLNLGWDAALPTGPFRPENHCAVSLRAERTDVIPSIDWLRPDGQSSIEMPGIILLNPESSRYMPEHLFTQQVSDVIATPVAELLDRTPSIVDLVPLLTAKPWFASLAARDQLAARGFEIPTRW